jgi:hypothetical protein
MTFYQFFKRLQSQLTNCIKFNPYLNGLKKKIWLTKLPLTFVASEIISSPIHCAFVISRLSIQTSEKIEPLHCNMSSLDHFLN